MLGDSDDDESERNITTSSSNSTTTSSNLITSSSNSTTPPPLEMADYLIGILDSDELDASSSNTKRTSDGVPTKYRMIYGKEIELTKLTSVCSQLKKENFWEDFEQEYSKATKRKDMYTENEFVRFLHCDITTTHRSNGCRTNPSGFIQFRFEMIYRVLRSIAFSEEMAMEIMKSKILPSLSERKLDDVKIEDGDNPRSIIQLIKDNFATTLDDMLK